MDAIEKARQTLFPNLLLKDQQLAAVKSILNKNDTIAALPVGYGKSLIYQLLSRIYEDERRLSKMIVISPLNAIIKDQLLTLRQLAIPAVGLDMNCRVMDMDMDMDISAYDAAACSNVILCHPEALFSADGQNLLLSLKDKVITIVVDECHKVEEWGREFRKSFADISELKSFFPRATFLCLSGTMMKDQITNLARCLNLSNPIIISSSPDVRNVYFVLEEKKKGDAITLMEDIFVSEIEKLRKEKNNYPITLMFMPLQYMAHAMRYAKKVFKNPSVEESLYVSIFSNQDKAVNDYVMKQLKMENPHIRLIFCTSVIGMGFDSPSVCNIIHVRPPRNLSNYMQEVGRAGRRGQQAKAIIYFNLSDIAPNVPGLQRDIVDLCTLTTCIREYILGHFGFKKDESSPIGCKCCNICCKKCSCEDCKLALHVSELNL